MFLSPAEFCTCCCPWVKSWCEIGGQLELAELLSRQALAYISNVEWATENGKKAAVTLQVEGYLELARAKTLFASEDRAVLARHDILAEALDNCGKALAIE